MNSLLFLLISPKRNTANSFTRWTLSYGESPSEIVIGADINANIGISTDRNDKYAPTLGPHGLKKQNSKG